MPTRMSCDDRIYEFSTQVLNLCKSSNLRILNGRTIGDSLGKYTCYKWNGCSVVDYAIYDGDFLRSVLSFKVLDILDSWSDHCPITLNLNIGMERNARLNADRNREIFWPD